ncbi:40S RIBOSOMAL PROTEIN S12 [Encephalitozoon cuniculi GB-M1]|uniref:40S RIBOSOMAL PROTEIN S12 n=2 Tax=Encephalitozoon cuniculi TaxID=6035 RepID=Q8SSK9_ENCCU|nr:40S ribosomal protein S12 [Encephalitozoon cuniculi GB-M1]7QEP_C2 Chain C2, 40S RIBOSOMAL PROTEIN S12 [Encephalitozoon cuniculi GB-M1]AGE96110.1 40S ribosomal protein S12 [Encephalitozoon cuniculi]KMV66745.1 40S ribosomal protein S12 [Encephalitozoon cuniculi EcunIII-L]UYI28461.1 ribosomal protein S12 [Encephalitozoon cuniculi]CAD24962.1 40S RIBOSOMAL PROTEIN S12 [Encephalitozoon cuniculi GB-M1]
MSEMQEPMMEPEMTLQEALSKVCKVSRTYCKLSRGAKETTKKMLADKMSFVMVAENAEPRISKLVMALAKKKNIPVISIGSCLELGRIVGVENVSSSGKVRSKGCCVAGVQDYCEQTSEAGFVQAALLKGISSQ